jgi:hypothetical protein
MRLLLVKNCFRIYCLYWGRIISRTLLLVDWNVYVLLCRHLKLIWIPGMRGDRKRIFWCCWNWRYLIYNIRFIFWKIENGWSIVWYVKFKICMIILIRLFLRFLILKRTYLNLLMLVKNFVRMRVRHILIILGSWLKECLSRNYMLFKIDLMTVEENIERKMLFSHFLSLSVWERLVMSRRMSHRRTNSL